MKLYPFQKQAVEFHLKHHYSLNASDMGTGKSLMALATAKAAKTQNILVIGPRFLEGTWLAEAAKLSLKITFIGYSMLHKHETEELADYDFWIADESHYLATPISIRTVAFTKHFKAIKPKYAIFLSGTPIKNRIVQLWSQLDLIGSGPLKSSGKQLDMSYHRFARHFCNFQEMKIHNRIVTKYLGLKESRHEEFRALLKDKIIRFKVEDVLQDLPEMSVKEVFLMLGEDPALAEEFEKYMSGKLKDSRSKRLSAVLKAPSTVDYCNGLIEGGSGPLLIFSDHIESATMIQRGIKNSALITGATDMSERQAIVEGFQAGKIPALVATIGTMATGFTLTAARNVIFNDISWVDSDNLQAEKRIHRIGQKNACIKHVMIGTPTDAHIFKTVESKQKHIKEAMG